MLVTLGGGPLEGSCSVLDLNRQATRLGHVGRRAHRGIVRGPANAELEAQATRLRVHRRPERGGDIIVGRRQLCRLFAKGVGDAAIHLHVPGTRAAPGRRARQSTTPVTARDRTVNGSLRFLRNGGGKGTASASGLHRGGGGDAPPPNPSRSSRRPPRQPNETTRGPWRGPRRIQPPRSWTASDVLGHRFV